MPMYDSLGDKYDQMIRWKPRLERETPFFQRLFSEKRIRSVLDLACGTGHHVKLFHKWGSEAIGVDPSPVLLEIARDGLEESDDSLRFLEADFLTFPKHLDHKVDVVICLGNSLPHVMDTRDMKQALKNVYEILKPGGTFVFQNRNYDRLIESQERFQFPATFRAGDNEQIFFRFNDFLDNKVRFNVVHFSRVGERWIHEVHSTDLRPWQQSELADLVTEIGFVAQNYYGDFSGTPFDANSSVDLVGLMRKQGETGN